MFNSFLDDKTYISQQIRFVNLIIDEPTSNGIVEPTCLCASTHVGLGPEGPEALFNSDELSRPARNRTKRQSARVCLAVFWERSEQPASNDSAQNLHF